MLKETYLAIAAKVVPEGDVKVYVTRTAGSWLSPHWDLLRDAKSGAIGWAEFERRFRRQIQNDQLSWDELEGWAEKARSKDVWFICYEKPPKPCHRHILLQLVRENWPEVPVAAP